MLLIVDSGSTKTDWALCAEDKKPQHFYSAGFNPMVQQAEFIETEIQKSQALLAQASLVSEIHYFGSGCSSSDRKGVISDILQSFFPQASIQVDHDMNGAVIATCGTEPGFACILGTGSNAVLFDGTQLVEPKGTLGIGYMLGDEGSGAYIGKRFLRDFLYKIMPKEISDYLEEHRCLSKDSVLLNVYKRPNPNSYMAQFALDIAEFKHLPYVQNLLAQSFDDFFRYNICSFENHQNYPVNFVGSIAANFSTELTESANRHGLQMGKIVHKPIDGIIEFFLRQNQKS